MLLATFSSGLVEGLRTKLARLTSGKPEVAGRIVVDTLPEVTRRLMKAAGRSSRTLDESEIDRLIEDAARFLGDAVDLNFLKEEWRLIVDAWDVRDRDRYREIPRLGRKVRMATSRRDEVWDVFERVRTSLAAKDETTEAALMHALANEMRERPFTHVVID